MHLCQVPSALPQPWPTCANPILFSGCKHWGKRKNGTPLKVVSLKQSGPLKRAKTFVVWNSRGEGTEVSGSRDGSLSGEERTRPQARNLAAYKKHAEDLGHTEGRPAAGPGTSAQRRPPHAGCREGPPPALCCSFPCNPNRHRNTALNKQIP